MSTEDTDTQDGLPPVSFQPLPNIITAFSADASPFEALAESVDNSIDYVRSRAYDGEEPYAELEIDITLEMGETPEESRIVIEDNAGGVEQGELSRFFQWGASVTAPESIGRFGVGASRIAALGGRIAYQSRAVGQETGFGFEVNVAEMEEHEGDVTDETYQADRQVVEDLEEGHTRIIIRDLKRGFDEIFNLDDESAEEALTVAPDELDEDTWRPAIEDFAAQFGDYFERYITEGISFEADYFDIATEHLDVAITVSLDAGDTVLVAEATPPASIEYSYLPFDSLFPRKYTSLAFDSDDSASPEDADVRADIEVGLMLKADDDKAGLTLYANDRKILSRNTNNPLFTGDYLGPYRSESGHGRLVIEVELSGEIDEMPVNSLKSDLDMNSPIANPLLRITKNAAKRYRKQTYSSLPGWMLRVYKGDHPFAANGGRVKRYDKSDSATNSPRFRKQPGSSGGRRMFEERDRLRAIVKIHQALRIRDETPLLPKEEPAYSEYFESEYADNLDGSEFIERVPTDVAGPDLNWTEISITADESTLEPVATIEALARQHYNKGGRADEANELQAWQIPRYREELRKLTDRTNLNEADLDVWDEIPEAVLTDALERLAAELEDVPSAADMDNEGLYKSSLYLQRFGSWEDALAAADLSDPSSSSQKNGEEEESDGGDTSSESGSQQGGETDSPTPTTDTVPVSSIEGSGIVINGEYYRVGEEDLELLEEILALSDESEPEEAWRALKDVLEWYQQMPGR